MKALISTIEPVETGYRVAQVEPDANIFAVADELFWTDCDDDCVADLFWYDPVDQTIKVVLQPELIAGANQPISQGAQDL